MKVRVGCRENTGASYPGAVLPSVSKELEEEAVSKTCSQEANRAPAGSTDLQQKDSASLR